MAEIRYLDFDLELERSGDGYRAEVLYSPGGGTASADVKLPFTQQDLDRLQDWVRRYAIPVRGIETPEIESIRTFGQRLFDAVFTGEVLDIWRQSQSQAEAESAGLRVRLRLGDSPLLLTYPWEFLYDRTHFVAQDHHYPIVRYLAVAEPVRPLRVQPPLRVLVMIANPLGPAMLDSAAEWDRLNMALHPLIDAGRVTLERLARPTLDGLYDQLLGGEYHILHFIGHGGFITQQQDGVLVLEGEERQEQIVSGRDLAAVLRSHRSLRLTLLNACEGARTSERDAFAGVAQSLVQQGMPAVIAMQYEISDKAAIAFADGFYRSLAHGAAVDTAVSNARMTIFTRVNTVEFGTPVLYLRSADGRIFDLPPTTAETVPPPREEAPRREDARPREKETPQEAPPPRVPETGARARALRQAALAAQDAERWGEAASQWQALLILTPNDTDATTQLRRAQAEAAAQTALDEAQRHFDAGRWQAALDAAGRVRKQRPNDSTAQQLAAAAQAKLDEERAAAKVQTRVTRLLTDARAAIQRRDWPRATDLLGQVLALDPDNAQARTLFQHAQGGPERDALFEQGVTLYGLHKWADAAECFKQVAEAGGDYANLANYRQECARQLQPTASAGTKKGVGCRMVMVVTAAVCLIVAYPLVRYSMSVINTAAGAPTFPVAAIAPTVATDPNMAALMSEIQTALEHTFAVEEQAFATGDVNLLQTVYSGPALNSETTGFWTVVNSGKYPQTTQLTVQVQSISTSADGQSVRAHAIINQHIIWRWRATNACSGEVTGTLPEDVILVRTASGWVVTNFQALAQWPAVGPCTVP